MELIFLSLGLFSSLSYAASASPAADNVIRLKPSLNPPPGISKPIDPSFAGFGIEPSNLFSFMGAADPNTFTLNLLNNLANYTGKPPHIRIGGNTQDYMVYREDQNQWTWINNDNAFEHGANKQDSMLIGPRFFEAANRLPNGTTVTWGLNLAYDQDDHIKQITTMAKQALTNCPNLKITSFEIGNEPDLYLQNGFRTGPWGGQIYTQQWLSRASAIHSQVLQPHGLPSNFFEAAATASTIGTDFQISDLLGFDICTAPSYLSGWNQHDYYYYIGVSGYPVSLSHLLQLSTTEDQFAAWTEQVQQAQRTPYPYALREMGVVGPIGLEGVTNVFGAALWTLNFLLYTASLGIAGIGFHMTDNSNASAWQPVAMYGRPAHVRPLYYGIVAFDQAIGPSCAARVAQYPVPQVPDGYGDFVRAYAVYQQQALATLVVVNGKVFNSSSSNSNSNSNSAPGSQPQKQRGRITVQLQLPPSTAGQTLYLAYLTNAGADATANTTWNGISFEQSGDGTPAQVSSSENTVRIANDGTATFSLQDTEAVVANLGREVGASTPGAETSCLNVPQKSPGDNDTDTTPTDPSSSSSLLLQPPAATGDAGTPNSPDDDAESGVEARFVLGTCTSTAITIAMGVMIVGLY
ncbi:uncharacterized protein GGS25DRAFT_480165 [Hypoxylon fragiforme]|uniref:uncharacterized protein n=1 Tax=Hypoxylon fragiforme TaxID=63214 RepID=UPI0020C6B3B1|nr:uncharacterized protein GGS25DRAFT_480165 [Hypoxylon fragiforme]KAI2610832.1 hypothetical protein GGS25DRAFT_480165 [Hypoxylon fragiforme]